MSIPADALDGPPHGAGRFAPSPTGDLHLGNLRTALLAWLFARSTGRGFLVRMEDLDERTRPDSAPRQLADLRAIGLDWDGLVAHQSDRRTLYDAAIARLAARGLTYECFCTRREIHAAPSAPHAPEGAYPGTCRTLTPDERSAKLASGRKPAVRLRAGGLAFADGADGASPPSFTIRDELYGEYTGTVDDMVLRRGDGTPAYNLAVVVDDGAQGIDQVVRGDDLLSSAPRQAYLATLLGLEPPTYAHVPLVLGPSGKRLAKRDGAVTLAEISHGGTGGGDGKYRPTAGPRVLALLARSLGLAGDGETVDTALLRARFDPAALPRRPWTAPVPLPPAGLSR